VEVQLAGVAGSILEAPAPGYFLSPGRFVLEVRDPNRKHRKVRVTIRRNQTTTVDLDKR
jgi:hypothetical protein